jgi:hypothetical protein
MGPYCKFCGQRCFVPVTYQWPEYAIRALRHITIVATCDAGQKLEKEKFGVCWNEVKDKLKEDGNGTEL